MVTRTPIPNRSKVSGFYPGYRDLLSAVKGTGVPYKGIFYTREIGALKVAFPCRSARDTRCERVYSHRDSGTDIPSVPAAVLGVMHAALNHGGGCDEYRVGIARKTILFVYEDIVG